MSAEATSSIWKFVEPHEFKLPPMPAGKTARSFLQKLFSGFAQSQKASVAEVVQSELKHAPNSLVDRLAPYPDWQNAQEEIYRTIEPWLEEATPDSFFRVFIAPYGSGLNEMLSLLAKNQKWEILTPPDLQQLRKKDYGWLGRIAQGQTKPLIIPRLESFFLRHYNGLDHIRELITMLFRNNQRCIVGCGSWLWQYLEVAMHIREVFGKHYYLQSFSAEDLQTFFCELAGQKNNQALVFRQADNGDFVLPPDITSKSKVSLNLSEKEPKNASFPSDFLKKLAAEARGIPLIAWSIWRNRLRLSPEEDVVDIAREVADVDATATRAKTIWVKAFKESELPQIPSNTGQLTAFLFVYLLQHDGLTSDAIFELLDFENDKLIGLLYRLQKAGLIVNENGFWRASWQGYPAIRYFLDKQDYLQDAM